MLIKNIKYVRFWIAGKYFAFSFVYGNKELLLQSPYFDWRCSVVKFYFISAKKNTKYQQLKYAAWYCRPRSDHYQMPTNKILNVFYFAVSKKIKRPNIREKKVWLLLQLSNIYTHSTQNCMFRIASVEEVVVVAAAAAAVHDDKFDHSFWLTRNLFYFSWKYQAVNLILKANVQKNAFHAMTIHEPKKAPETFHEIAVDVLWFFFACRRCFECAIKSPALCFDVWVYSKTFCVLWLLRIYFMYLVLCVVVSKMPN